MKGLLNTLSKAGLNGFFFCLIGTVVLAYFFPSLGAENSVLPLSAISQYGVSIIFFFYGLKFSPEKMKAGLVNWKLHLLIQATTFILFPVLIIVAKQAFETDATALWWLGTFYLAALPSTVSSSVVMISIAGGNMPAAIFNASISSIIGVFITPFWMSVVFVQNGSTIDTTDVVTKLCIQVIMPVLLGLALHKWLGFLTDRYKVALRYFDQTIILLIVFTSFCEAFAGHMFEGHTVGEIALVGLCMLILFLSVFGLMYVLSNVLKLNREDRITVLFCGSKKSLVQGAVMGRVLFPDPLLLGVVLLPLMMYHALQLVASSIIAEGMAGNSEAE